MVSPVRWEQHGHTGYIRLHRPEAMNAINVELLTVLSNILERIEQNPRDVRVIVIEGEGKAFSTGADLKERRTMNEEQVRQFLKQIREVFMKLERLPQPTIAAMNGYAFGGGLELALACDFRYSVRDAIMGLTEVSLGIIPGAGGTQRLPRLVGVSKAKELILTARKITADQAYALGILHGVSENHNRLREITQGLANEILANAPLAVYQAKLAIDQGIDTDLETGLEVEAKAYEAILPTKDRLEALEAFREKRTPRFIGE